jgi:hypothetical protein
MDSFAEKVRQAFGTLEPGGGSGAGEGTTRQLAQLSRDDVHLLGPQAYRSRLPWILTVSADEGYAGDLAENTLFSLMPPPCWISASSFVRRFRALDLPQRLVVREFLSRFALASVTSADAERLFGLAEESLGRFWGQPTDARLAAFLPEQTADSVRADIRAAWAVRPVPRPDEIAVPAWDEEAELINGLGGREWPELVADWQARGDGSVLYALTDKTRMLLAGAAYYLAAFLMGALDASAMAGPGWDLAHDTTTWMLNATPGLPELLGASRRAVVRKFIVHMEQEFPGAFGSYADECTDALRILWHD